MSNYILEIKNLTKTFPGVTALKDVSLNVKAGQIHSICGENGAGKSTLMSCISGVYSKTDYQGAVYFKGRQTNYHSVKDSEKDGLAIIHQELALSPYLSIYENLFLGHMDTKFGIINWNKYIKESRKYLDIVGLPDPPETIVSKLGVGKQQLVEIARALSKKAELLILDEPTSSLNDDESEKLLNLLLEFKKQGITLLIISHKLNEVLKIADTVTIIRDGASINTYDVKATKLTEEQIIKDMVGRDLTERFPQRIASPKETVLEVKNWTVYHPEYHSIKVVDNVSFYLKKGEILAFCGPMGAGRTELMMSLFGKSYGSRIKGELYINGKQRTLGSAQAAIEAGLGFVSEDRKTLGLNLIQDVKTNIAHASLRTLSRFGIVDSKKETTEAERYCKELRIRTPSVNQIVRNLSGGNQQKVVLSKSLLANPDIFIIDEPTRGIDIGAKTEIYGILNNLIAADKSIIMVSSELPEALGMADRFYVMNNGTIRGMLHREEATQEKNYAFGISWIKEK